MTTCIACKHWSPKDGEPAMARMGFAPCLIKHLPGHTTSAHARQCDRFTPASAEVAQQRAEWLAKQ